MIQDIAPHTYHNEYHPLLPESSAILLYFEDGEVLAKYREEEDQIVYPRFGELADQGASMKEACRFLFAIDDTRYYLVMEKPAFNEDANAAYNMESISLFREARPKHESFAGITGYQLWNWYRANRYCGRCGKPMTHADNERMMFCKECHHMVYPKISPAVIVGVLDGERILMTKYTGRAYKRYALIAGFNEIGESIEDTVRREVMEEVGLRVKNIRYYKSQPWSFSDTLLMGFYCDLDGDDTIRLDTDELSVGEWIDRADIPETSDWLSLTNEMILRFQRGEE
ncbi:MAG: NAD(+) diphosphatase [Firmicutes bacterium]|nr:NAD(+) diphosphatase [Bacillota bacterium]